MLSLILNKLRLPNKCWSMEHHFEEKHTFSDRKTVRFKSRKGYMPGMISTVRKHEFVSKSQQTYIITRL
jgi:hypothetical protein